MLVEGFGELGTLATIYNHPYYPQHLERLGYVKDTDWLEYEISLPEELPASVAKLSEILKRRYQLSLLEVRSKKDLLRYAGELFELLNEAYEHLYGVTPLTPRQIQAYILQYFDFISPEFVPIILDGGGRLVAFGISLPSLSRALQKAIGKLLPFGFIYLISALTHNDRADLYLVAVKEEYRGKGLNAILIERMYHVFRRRGIRKIESNPELETNLNVQTQWKLFETRQHKRRRCYIKPLGDSFIPTGEGMEKTG
jgi:GNAT superfamily N-acetyltransferase